MTTPNLSVRFPAPFPATVAGAGGIAVEKENGVWIIAPDFSALAEILPAALADPSARQIWVYDPVGDEYNVLTLAGLGSALYGATSVTSVAIGAGAKTFTTQAGKDFSVGSFVLATSDADPTNYLLGQVTAYSGTSLTISVAAAGVGGSGTHSDWTLRMSSPAGPAGSTGAAGRNAGFRYLWSTNTVSSDPTSGRIKVNNAAPGSATALYISETDAEGNPLANEIASWDDSSDPNVKAQIKISKASAPGTNFLLLNLTAALTDNGAWDSFAVGSGQLVGTFADGDAVDVTIRRTGNKGADGAGAGDVVGPASATNNGFVKFNGTTGKLLKDSAATVAVLDGGTGASTASGARGNLGLVIGTDVQAPATTLSGYGITDGVAAKAVQFGGDTNSSVSGFGSYYAHSLAYTIPANFLIAGRVLKVMCAWQVTSGSSAPTLEFQLKAGGTILAHLGPVAVTANGTNTQYVTEYIIQATASPGASVNVETAQMGNANGIAGATAQSDTPQPVALATNGLLLLTLETKWSAAGTGTNLIKQSQLVVQAIG